MKIAIAQINPTVGDIAGNCAKIIENINLALGQNIDLVVFSELSVVGYPPRDLLSKQGFIEDSMQAVTKIAESCSGISAVVGFVNRQDDKLYNSAAIISDGKILRVVNKSLLPSYDVFDEKRYFDSGSDNAVIEIAGVKVGVAICEDLWDSQALGGAIYSVDPVGELIEQGVELLVSPAASPFEMNKASAREDLFARQAQRADCPVVYCNQVGGNDQLIFDGCSSVTDSHGQIVARAKSFEDDFLVVELDRTLMPVEPLVKNNIDSEMTRLKSALEVGIRDYVRKCGFKSVVLGLSGGIDSALVAALACSAIGAENVYGIAMPSRHSSDHSIKDAQDLADNLGCNCVLVPIEPMHSAFEESIKMLGSGRGSELAAENIQARIRGSLVMALSNAQGHLPVATGNKSELAVGYCTLYGDMCGGLAPIGDVLKTQVYELSEFINKQAGRELIPVSTITKPPSAELKPGQVDQDSLPDYDTLDGILKMLIEQSADLRNIVSAGFDRELVSKIAAMVDRAEFKRQQAAGVLKVSPKAFGIGRRVPIAQRYRQNLA